MDTATAHWVYRHILVPEAGAPDGAVMENRFASYFGSRHPLVDERPLEYPIGGTLGPSGRFRIASREWYVDCAPEDLTSERSIMIARTNDALVLFQFSANRSALPREEGE